MGVQHSVVRLPAELLGGGCDLLSGGLIPVTTLGVRSIVNRPRLATVRRQLISGSWRTGKLTEEAMKHRFDASSCSCTARSIIEASATVTTGRKMTSFEAPAAVVVFEHHADGGVGVARDDDATDRATVQVREQVALAERRDEKEFRVPSRLVASEEGVG